MISLMCLAVFLMVSAQDVQLYDLVLTTSARMLTLTGDIHHRDNYFLKVEPLEEIHFGHKRLNKWECVRA